MTEIRYVILSDLHFGAENSVLTALNERLARAGSDRLIRRPAAAEPAAQRPDRRAARAHPRPEQAADPHPGGRHPRSGSVARRDVRHGLPPLRAPGLRRPRRPVFDPVIHYVPGNHDHHQWEITRERPVRDLRLRPARRTPNWSAPGTRRSCEPAAERPVASSALLTGLARSQTGGTGVEVHVSYPNLALRTPRRAPLPRNQPRALHRVHLHADVTAAGHPLPRAAAEPGRQDIDRLEEENFAWIDFFWCTLGRSGQVGTDMGLIYADLTSPRDIDALVSNLVAAHDGQEPRLAAHAGAVGTDAVLAREANQGGQERARHALCCTDSRGPGRAHGTTWRVRFAPSSRHELGFVPDEVTLVYGHTHKPFVDRLVSAWLSSLVYIANTGGWVVDTTAPAPVQAGVAVLVNENLDAASLQFYRQSPDRLRFRSSSCRHQPDSSHLPGTLNWRRESTRRWRHGRRWQRPPRNSWLSATGFKPRSQLSRRDATTVWSKAATLTVWFGVSGEVADSMAEGRPGLLPQVADEVRGGCRGR